MNQTTALVPLGIVTWCCDFHRAEDCCDPSNCGPCCPECPTCPTVAQYPPDVRRAEARAMRELIVEAQAIRQAGNLAVTRLRQEIAAMVAAGSTTPIYDATVAALYGPSEEEAAPA